MVTRKDVQLTLYTQVAENGASLGRLIEHALGQVV